METRSNHFSFEDRERRENAQFIAITCWAFATDPDPTYDPVNGWKLDQFAMASVPDRAREYKRICKEEYPSPPPIEPFVPSLKQIEIRGKLAGEIRRHLLNARFEVRGYQFGSYAPMVIPKALLESMKPVIETSELLELNVPYETARRFEHVRVFKLKAGPGAERQYGWPAMARQLEKEGVDYPTDAKLVRYCRENLLLSISGERPDPLPADKTTREAITKYGLWRFSKERGQGSGKKRPG
jgi:hypothetical protein